MRQSEETLLLKGIDVGGRAVLAQHHDAWPHARHGVKVRAQRRRRLLRADVLHERLAVARNAQRGLARSLRGKARDARADGLVQLAARLAKARGELVSRRRVRIELALAGRIGVGQTRQHEAHAGDVLVHMAAGVHDAPVSAAQDDVRVAAHHLHDERAGDGIAQLGERGDVDFQNAVARDAPHGAHTPAADVLAQQHAQHRRLHGAGLGMGRQVHARAAGRGAQQQAMVFALRADEQMNLVALGLNHAVDAPVPELFVELAGDKAEHHAVHRHGSYLR